MERGEQEPFKTINWLRDEDGYYFNIRTDTGIYDINQRTPLYSDLATPT